MLISCPKCKTVYEIPAGTISPDGRYMSCSKCSEVFLCKPEDALIEQFIDMENAVPDDTKKHMNDILAAQQNSEKSIHKSTKLNVILSLVATVFVLLCLIFLRYDIVRLAPFAEKAYDFVGLESIYRGRNLEFVNIARHEFIENNISKLEITGEIYNTGKYVVMVPNINLQIVDKKGQVVLFEEHKIELNRLNPDNTLSFKIISVNPTPYAKSIYLTFAEK